MVPCLPATLHGTNTSLPPTPLLPPRVASGVIRARSAVSHPHVIQLNKHPCPDVFTLSPPSLQAIGFGGLAVAATSMWAYGTDTLCHEEPTARPAKAADQGYRGLKIFSGNANIELAEVRGSKVATK